MGIGPDQRNYMQKTLLAALANFYGDRVPNLVTFTSKRRASFIAKLEEAVGAPELRAKITEVKDVAGRAQGVLTRLTNEQDKAKTELKAKHDLEIAELQRRQEKERFALVEHYQPALLDAKSKVSETSTERDKVERAAYFAILDVEDDGRYVPQVSIEAALKQRVDGYIGLHLMDDEDGVAVQGRVKQETLIGDAVWVAKDMLDLRGLILGFIHVGKLPPLTIEAWLIENGVDLKQ